MAWDTMLRAFARAAAANKGSGKKIIDDAAERFVKTRSSIAKDVYKDEQLDAYKALQAKRPGISAERRMSELGERDAQEEWDRAFDYAVHRQPYNEAERAGENRFKAINKYDDDYWRTEMLDKLRDKTITPADVFREYDKNRL